MRDAIVVGGGIAGLAAAWKMRHLDVLLLERDLRIGGRIRSERRGPYWLNWGAHVYNGPTSATGRLLDGVGVQAAPVPGILNALAINGRLLTSGRVEGFPFRVPMSRAARAAALRAGLKVRLAVRAYARVVAERPDEDYRVRQQRIYDYLGDRSFADFIGPLPPDAEALFRPTVTRSAGEMEEISAGAGVGYFHLVWDRSGGLGRNIVGGPSTLTGALAAALGERVRLGREVRRVRVGPDAAEVTWSEPDGRETVERARHVVVATPAPIARAIVADLPDELDAALGALRYGSYVSAAFLTNERGPARWDPVYAIATPKRSFNVFFNMSSVVRGAELRREPGSSIMVFSPGRLARALIDRPDEEILATYLADIAGVFPELPGQVAESRVQRWPLGLAYNFPGRGRLQAALTAPHGRLHLAGDYLGNLYTETAIRTGVDAAQDIVSEVTSNRG